MSFLFAVGAFVLPWCTVFYNCTGFLLLGGIRTRLANAVWAWTKWPAFLGLFVSPLWDMLHQNTHWYSTLTYVLNGVIWWLLRNAGDDDPGKKLMKKLKEKVEVIHSKLVVVPATA